MRGRRISAFATVALLALAGCGGDGSAAPEVPGPPASFSVPDTGVTPAGADTGTTDSTGADTGTTDSTGTDTGTTGDTGTTPEATPTPDTSGDTGTTTTPDASGGAAAPDTAQSDGPTNDTAPPEGSNAQQFEDFCAQNPGAC